MDKEKKYINQKMAACRFRNLRLIFLNFFLSNYTIAQIYIENSSQFFVADSIVIFQKDNSNKSKKQYAKIYVSKGTIFSNVDEASNAKIFYIEKDLAQYSQKLVYNEEETEAKKRTKTKGEIRESGSPYIILAEKTTKSSFIILHKNGVVITPPTQQNKYLSILTWDYKLTFNNFFIELKIRDYTSGVSLYSFYSSFKVRPPPRADFKFC